jgi:HlyD family secretion protein
LQDDDVNKPVERQERLDIQAILGSNVPNEKAGGGRVKWLVLLALVFAGGWLWWSRATTQDSITYATAAATRGAMVVNVTATGSIQPTNKVDVSSELSGTVRDVFVDYNSAVTAGQKLAELDTDKLVAIMGSSRAKLAAAQAHVADAKQRSLRSSATSSARKHSARSRYPPTRSLTWRRPLTRGLLPRLPARAPMSAWRRPI